MKTLIHQVQILKYHHDLLLQLEDSAMFTIEDKHHLQYNLQESLYHIIHATYDAFDSGARFTATSIYARRMAWL